MILSVGDTVTFLGCGIEQARWARCDDGSNLTIGQQYRVADIEIHTWHTKIRLEGVEGRYNSVCFAKEVR